MSRRNKLKKFADILSFTNVFENFNHEDSKLTLSPGQELEMAGQWNSFYFKNNNPITLELACGRGEYSLALAEQFPERNFIGVDIKGARIWQGSTRATTKGLDNVAFLRTRIEMISSFFSKDEVDEIWITFPDPFLRESKENNRLTSPPFLSRYKNIIKSKGLLHLKTDDPTLYNFSMETLSDSEYLDIEYNKDEIYASPLVYPELEYKTYYELMHIAKGRTIKYIRCRYK